MKRETRALMAKETVAICEAGFYIAPNGTRVDIGADLDRARKGTVLCSPERLPNATRVGQNARTRLEARNETAFAALARLASSSSSQVACLNFASAKNPGGGFLNGSLAQEEALACASGLYPCLLTAPDYYARNRASRSALYLDLAIFSPKVPFFRNDAGVLLEKALLASVITAPAPNAGAVARNEPGNSNLVEPTLRCRAEFVLAIAQANGVEQLVLGAWGCGVFRNDPRTVAAIFAGLMKPPGRFAGAFGEVVFAVFDRSDDLATFRAFAERFNGGAS